MAPLPARTGISAHKRSHDLSDFSAELDMIEALGVETIELPTYDMDIVVGCRVRRPQLEALKRACSGRSVAWSAHGPLAINFMDEPYRLQRHFDVLEASMNVAAEIGAVNYVLHAGLAPVQQADGLEAAYDRQREALSRAADIARDLGIVICVETLFAGFDGRMTTASPRRLADELKVVSHPNLCATIDFSHSYLKLDYDGRRADFIAEIAALAPFANHLHVHDSFGRQDDIWMYGPGEQLAYGHGDLHLPVGWGDIPFADIVEVCTFPSGVVFNIELEARYWYAAEECVAKVKSLAAASNLSSLVTDNALKQVATR